MHSCEHVSITFSPRFSLHLLRYIYSHTYAPLMLPPTVVFLHYVSDPVSNSASVVFWFELGIMYVLSFWTLQNVSHI